MRMASSSALRAQAWSSASASARVEARAERNSKAAPSTALGVVRRIARPAPASAVGDSVGPGIAVRGERQHLPCPRRSIMPIAVLSACSIAKTGRLRQDRLEDLRRRVVPLGRAQHEDGIALLEVVERVDVADAVRMLVDHVVDTGVAGTRQHRCPFGSSGEEPVPTKCTRRRAATAGDRLAQARAGRRGRHRARRCRPAAARRHRSCGSGRRPDRTGTARGARCVTSSKSSDALPIGIEATTACFGHVGIALEHAGEIARRHAGDQRGVSYRPRLEPRREPV